MINVNGETQEVTTEGSVPEVAVELLAIIGSLYSKAKEDSPFKARLFRAVIVTELNNKKFWDLAENTK